VLPSITESTDGELVVLTLIGDFDLLVRGELSSALQRVDRYDPARRRVHVDLSRVGYIDCGSLRAIGRLLRHRHRLGDPATLVVISPFLRKMVDLAGVVEPGFVVEQLEGVA
jgi:anti-anti-sigma regulatory factor